MKFKKLQPFSIENVETNLHFGFIFVSFYVVDSLKKFRISILRLIR